MLAALKQRLARSVTQQAPRAFTTAEARAIVTAAFKKFGNKTLASLVEVERTDPRILDAQTTERTILSVAVTALNDAGIKTDSTVGAVRGKLEMTPDQVDEAFCYCVNGAEISGDRAAARMNQLG